MIIRWSWQGHNLLLLQPSNFLYFSIRDLLSRQFLNGVPGFTYFGEERLDCRQGGKDRERKKAYLTP
jgi:hypothetical protein